MSTPVIYILKPNAGELKVIVSKLISCPAGSIFLEEIVITNQSTSDDFIRLYIGPSIITTSFLFYDTKIKGNSTMALEFKHELPKDTVIRVYSRFGNISFTVFTNGTC